MDDVVPSRDQGEPSLGKIRRVENDFLGPVENGDQLLRGSKAPLPCRDVSDTNDDGSNDSKSGEDEGAPVVSKYFAGMANDDDDLDRISSMSDTDEEAGASQVSEVPKAAALKASKGPRLSKKKQSTAYLKTPAGPCVGPLSTLRPDPDKCDLCFRLRLKCDLRLVQGERCSPCTRAQRRCVEQTAATKALIPVVFKVLPKERPIEERCRYCYTVGRKCIFDDDSGICIPCRNLGRKSKCNMDLTGAKKSDRSSEGKPTRGYVPRDEKCTYCLKHLVGCNGEVPCNKCMGHPIREKKCAKQPKKGEVPKDQMPMCLPCFGSGRYCDRGKPCRSCVENEEGGCTYVCNDGLLKRVYVPVAKNIDQGDPKEDDIDPPECGNCHRKDLNCDHRRPCYQCVRRMRSGMYLGSQTCCYGPTDGVREISLVRPYTLDEDEESVLRDNWKDFVPERQALHMTLEGQKKMIRIKRERQPRPTIKPVRTGTNAIVERAFPHGYDIVDTPSDGLQCMIYAITLSMRKQHPNLQQPTTTEIQKILDEPEFLQAAQATGMTNTNNFSADQGAALLHYWGRQQGLHLQLGYIAEGEEPLLVPVPDGEGERHILWIHNDNAQSRLTEQGFEPEGTLNHWSALRPKLEPRSLCRKRGRDDDSDLEDDNEDVSEIESVNDSDAGGGRKGARGQGQHSDDDVDADIGDALAMLGLTTRCSAKDLSPHDALAVVLVKSGDDLLDPQNYAEAMAAPDAGKFQDAIAAEIASLKKNDTYDVVDLPADMRPITSRFVFKRKLGQDGKVKMHKARMVARGFQQREGVDFDETFAAVVKPSSYRILFAMSAALGWHIHQMDVKTAFLNGDLDKPVYMKPPRGVRLPRGKVMRLSKALYGLKQAPRTWSYKFTATLVGWGWRVNGFDLCVFINDSQELILCLWVDDILIFGKDEMAINAFKIKLAIAFEMTDEGPCIYYLGIHVERGPDYVRLHQAQYVEQILKKYGFKDAVTLSTPGRHDEKLRRQKDKLADPAFKLDYQSKVGSLNFLANQTRPDICFSTGYAARYASNPDKTHADAVSHIF